MSLIQEVFKELATIPGDKPRRNTAGTGTGTGASRNLTNKPGMCMSFSAFKHLFMHSIPMMEMDEVNQ